LQAQSVLAPQVWLSGEPPPTVVLDPLQASSSATTAPGTQIRRMTMVDGMNRSPVA
jgi:hypothetical protein